MEIFLNLSFKDVIIRGGENIYPREIEEILHKHKDIAEVHVCGVPDLKVWHILFKVIFDVDNNWSIYSTENSCVRGSRLNTAWLWVKNKWKSFANNKRSRRIRYY